MLDRVIPIVYQELRRLAHLQMRRERAGDTLQTTALINETYLLTLRPQQSGKIGIRFAGGVVTRSSWLSSALVVAEFFAVGGSLPGGDFS